MTQVIPSQIGNSKFTEKIINHRGCHLKVVISGNHSIRLKTAENKGVDIFLQRNSVLQTQADGNGKTVHQTSKCRAFLVHIDKYLPNSSVRIFSCAQINLMTAHRRFLSITFSAAGQFLTLSSNNFLGNNFCSTLNFHSRRFILKITEIVKQTHGSSQRLTQL